LLDNLLRLTLSLGSPLILAAMGGYCSERGGVINIGLEGLMLSAACVVAVAGPIMNPVMALTAALGVTVLLSLLHWLATQRYGIDHVISGMAINAIAAGGTNFLFGRFANPDRSGPVPTLALGLFEGLAMALPLVLWAYSRWTRGGLRLRAVGGDPEKARLAGVAPGRVRLAGLVAAGIFAGLGGAMLVSDTGVFTNDMTAGRGYIALAALILGGWRPLPAMGVCLAFGFFNALQLQLQGQVLWGLQPPSELWASLPYIATIVALAGFLGRNRTPAGLGKL
jgi:simple sugar transport system permease protein